MRSGIENLGSELWVAHRPLPLRGVGDVGARMTVMRFADRSLMLHSPVDAMIEKAFAFLPLGARSGPSGAGRKES